MAKFTVIRTDKKNVQHVKLQTIEEIMKSVRSDFVNRNVQELREYAAASEYLGRPNMSRLPKVHPAFEAKVDKQGDMQIQHINGLLTLSIGLLDARNSREEARSVKRMVSILPTTVAAFMGSSGKTVKVIVSISRPDGSTPQNEEDAEKLFRQAYPLACRIYGVALDSLQTVNRLTVGSALRDGTKLLHAGFRMSYDDEPYVSANAVPPLHFFDLSNGQAAVAHMGEFHGGDQGVDDGFAFRRKEIFKYFADAGHAQGFVWQLVGKHGDHAASLAFRFPDKCCGIGQIFPDPLFPVKQQADDGLSRPAICFPVSRKVSHISFRHIGMIDAGPAAGLRSFRRGDGRVRQG